jgi:hypothetical protein
VVIFVCALLGIAALAEANAGNTARRSSDASIALGRVIGATMLVTDAASSSGRRSFGRL